MKREKAHSFPCLSDLVTYVNSMLPGKEKSVYLSLMEKYGDDLELWKSLEETAPAGQMLHLFEEVIFITFSQKRKIASIGNAQISFSVTFVGIPLSLSRSGFLYLEEHTSRLPDIIKDFTRCLKGTVIVLNSPFDIHKGYLTESSYTLHHVFESFDAYLGAMRASYLRKVRQVLKRSENLTVSTIMPSEFTEEHYDLYLSVHERMKMKLITMPLSYFQSYDAVILEIRDHHQLLAFMQLKEIGGSLYFILGGFHRNQEKYSHKPALSPVDLYYAMLLHVIKYGILHGFLHIVLGQTAAESKSKVGAAAELIYIYASSSNPIVRIFLSLFPKAYSFTPYGIVHNVFKSEREQQDKAQTA